MTAVDDRRDEVSPVGERPDSEAVIKEARRLQRRRRLVIATVCVVMMGAVVGGLVISRGAGDRHSGGDHPMTASSAPTAAPSASAAPRSRVALPPSALFNTILVTPEGLLLTGVTKANGESPASSRGQRAPRPGSTRGRSPSNVPRPPAAAIRSSSVSPPKR